MNKRVSVFIPPRVLSTLLLCYHTSLLARDSTLLAPTFNLLVEFLPAVFHIVHHLVDPLASISPLALTQALPNRHHEIHDRKQLVGQPSDDWAAASGLRENVSIVSSLHELAQENSQSGGSSAE
jgi:hypothetical protein